MSGVHYSTYWQNQPTSFVVHDYIRTARDLSQRLGGPVTIVANGVVITMDLDGGEIR